MDFFLDDLAHRPHDPAVPVTVVIRADDHLVLFGQRDQFVGLGRGQHEGLFGHHMLPGLHALGRQRVVQVVRGDVHQQVHVAAFQHGVEAAVGLDARKVLGGDGQSFGIHFADGEGRHAGPLHFFEVVAAHVEGAAVADDADLDVGGGLEVLLELGHDQSLRGLVGLKAKKLNRKDVKRQKRKAAVTVHTLQTLRTRESQ